VLSASADVAAAGGCSSRLNSAAAAAMLDTSAAVACTTAAVAAAALHNKQGMSVRNCKANLQMSALQVVLALRCWMLLGIPDSASHKPVKAARW
jgi:hypothetical protein